MLNEKLKKQIDNLNEEQLRKIADFIASNEFQSQQYDVHLNSCDYSLHDNYSLAGERLPEKLNFGVVEKL